MLVGTCNRHVVRHITLYCVSSSLQSLLLVRLLPTSSFATLCSWAILFIMGHVRDMWRARYGSTKKVVIVRASDGGAQSLHADQPRHFQRFQPALKHTLDQRQVLCTSQGYAPVRQNYEDFYTRRMYYRIHVSLFSACA